MHIGCHLSSAGGFLAMGRTALSIGADTFQFFTRNPRGGAAKPIDPDDAAVFRAFAAEHRFARLIAHAPYTLNPCAAAARVAEFARTVLADDLIRMEAVPGSAYNLHPGSHVGQGAAAGIAKTAALLNDLITPEQTTLVLLETMSGKGSEIAGTFEEIAELLAKIRLPDHLGVCLDTCHVYSAGYDLVHDLDGVLARFDSLIGLKYLKAIHLNDSMTPFASHLDRHACLGAGSLGLPALLGVVNHPRLRELPFILETPNELPGYAAEIALMRGGARS